MIETRFNFIIDEHTAQPFYFLGCGMNGVGKSTTGRKILETIRPKHPRQIVVPSGPMADTWADLPTFPIEDILMESAGIYIHQVDRLKNPSMADERELFFYNIGCQLNAIDKCYKFPIEKDQRILFDALTHPRYGFNRGTILFDDFKKYLKGYHEDGGVLDLLGDRLHKDLSLIFYCHDPSEIPPYMTRKNPLLLLWATSGNLDGAAHKIRKDIMDQVNEAQSRINRIHEEGKAEGNWQKRGYCEPIMIETENPL